MIVATATQRVDDDFYLLKISSILERRCRDLTKPNTTAFKQVLQHHH